MSQHFNGRIPSLSGPATDIAPVTPNDAADLAMVAVAIYVETGGTLRLTTVRGEQRDVVLPDNAILPVGTVRIHATGTTASGIHALVV